MHWSAESINGWGYGLMTISVLAFWGLVISSVLLLLRRPEPAPLADAAHISDSRPEQLLAERSPRGDTDKQECINRLDTLRDRVSS